jgi:D-beta-D-heptose 7-phosphate kinase / D-beta-D-heptose 1-phosphate adenosyltransferase
MNLYIGDNQPKIIILGDIILDHNIEGKCNKIANEGPIPVINNIKESYNIGGCGNVLMNMVRLGAKSIYLFSRIGSDNNGHILQSLLPDNVYNYLLNDDTIPTITKTRIYADKKIVARYDKEETKNITDEQKDTIVSNIKYILNTNTISSVVFSDYNKGFLTKSLCQSIISLCNEFNIPTIVDPKYDYTKYVNCTVIKPNKEETKNIFNIDLNNISLYEGHKELHKLLDCKMSVITLSGDGISTFDNINYYKIKEDTKDVIDVTGAGDIVNAVLGTYYPYITDIKLLITIANHLASISVGHLGVYEINDLDLIKTHKFIHNSKLITIDMISKLNLNNIVFTNGCFDILHSAHIELFKFCKSLGNTVILGINSDDSIRRLKGSSRPINNLSERIKMLNAVAYVDFIVIFDDNTPLDIIKKINPDFLVKGGDYKIDTIVGREYAKNTVIFNYIDGVSTTNMVNKIKNRV